MIRQVLQGAFMESGWAGAIRFREALNLFLHLESEIVISGLDFKYFISTGHE